MPDDNDMLCPWCGGDDVFMPKPNRTDVWTNGSATSLAPRHAAFAMMGR